MTLEPAGRLLADRPRPPSLWPSKHGVSDSLRTISLRLREAEDALPGPDVSAAFDEFADESDALSSTDPPATASTRARSRRAQALVFITEPDCGEVFLARNIAAAMMTGNFVAVSLLRRKSPHAAGMLAVLEDTAPDSFLAISKSERESWAGVPPESSLVVLSAETIFFESRAAVRLDHTLSSAASRHLLIDTYSADRAAAS